MKVQDLLLIAAAAGLLTACPFDGNSPSQVENIYSPAEWRTLFTQHGWKPLPIPDSKYEPGAIIRVNEATGIRYIDHLRSCDYPAEILTPEIGKIPGLTFTKSREIGASAILNIKGISAGPAFANVAKAQMDVSEHSADALRLVKLRIWQEEPGNLEGNARFCIEELEKPDYYLITEAFRVSKGKYSLYDKSGAKLKLSLANLGQLLKLEPDLKYEVTAEGELVIEERVTFAIRQAVSTTAGFDVLGAPETEVLTADALIDELYQEEAGL